jgi:hypothetical protein
MNDIIESLIDKVSSYNLFNYLFPGVVFLVGLELATAQPLPRYNLVVYLFLAYFTGITLSRIGSLIIEPFLRWLHLVRFCPYNDFVSAERTDSKLTSLSQENNTFRTLIAVFLSLLAAKSLILLKVKYPQSRSSLAWVLWTALLLLFLFAYRKQTAYIVKRVAAAGK